VIDLLKYLDARLNEGGTWASIAAMLIMVHINIDLGLWHTITTYGIIVAGALGVVLAEAGSKPNATIAADVIKDIAAALQSAPEPPPAPAEPKVPAPAAPAAV
jgi:hypothetical protein